MQISFHIARRYFLSKKNPQAVNIISWIAVCALAIGTLALSVLLSVFSGLEALNKDLYKNINPDIKVEPKNGKDFTISPLLIDKIKNIKGIVAVSQTIEEKVYLRYRAYDHLAYLKGVDSIYDKVMSFNKNLLIGDPLLPYAQEGIWVGLGVAQRLSLTLEDRDNPVSILALKSGKGLVNATSFYRKESTAVGIFHMMEDIDEKYVYSSLEFAQDLLDRKACIYSLEIKAIPEYNLNSIKKDLSEILGGKFVVKTRQEQQEALFKMINTENFILYLLLCLILIITSFSLVGAIVILILDKKEQIRVLWNMGMPLRQIRNIFFYVGGFITFSGWLIGLFIGHGLAFGQKKFSWITVNQSIAFPVRFTLENFMLISFTVWIIGLLGAYCSSRRLGIPK